MRSSVAMKSYSYVREGQERVTMFLGHVALNLFSPDLNDLRSLDGNELNLGSPLGFQLSHAPAPFIPSPLAARRLYSSVFLCRYVSAEPARHSNRPVAVYRLNRQANWNELSAGKIGQARTSLETENIIEPLYSFGGALCSENRSRERINI